MFRSFSFCINGEKILTGKIFSERMKKFQVTLAARFVCVLCRGKSEILFSMLAIGHFFFEYTITVQNVFTQLIFREC